VAQPIGWKKNGNPETAARAGHLFVSCSEIAANNLARAKFKTRGIKHG